MDLNTQSKQYVVQMEHGLEKNIVIYKMFFGSFYEVMQQSTKVFTPLRRLKSINSHPSQMMTGDVQNQICVCRWQPKNVNLTKLKDQCTKFMYVEY